MAVLKSFTVDKSPKILSLYYLYFTIRSKTELRLQFQQKIEYLIL